MTEEIDLITFDAGGTLFDMSPTRDEVFIDILSHRFPDLDETLVTGALAKADRVFDEEFAAQDGKNEKPFWKKFDAHVLSQLGMGDRTAEIHAELDAAFREIIPRVDSWVQFPETKRVLERIRKRDFRLGVISNATDLTKRVMDNLDLTRYFDFVMVSEEVGVRKPSPEIFRMAAQKGGAALSRSLHVGDKFAVDVVGARRAGMNAVLLDRTHVYDDLDCIRSRDLDFFAAFV